MLTWNYSMVRTTISAAFQSDLHFPEKLQRANPNLDVLDEYKTKNLEYQRRYKDLEDITKQRDAQKQKHDDLRAERLDKFMAGFNAISLKLKEMYQASCC